MQPRRVGENGSWHPPCSGRVHPIAVNPMNEKASLLIVDDELGRTDDRIRFVSLKVVCGSTGPQTADLGLSIDGVERAVQASGQGPVDATFNAIKALFPHEARLQLYQVHAVTEGTDAQAQVTVRMEEAGKSVNGQASDVDTLVASARAYVHALNKLLDKRQKQAPAAIPA